MQDYLIGDGETNLSEMDFSIVSASDRESAIDKYISQVAINDPHFVDHLAERSTNSGFGSHFWLMTDEENQAMEEDGRTIISIAEFERRVQAFFREWPGYADNYMKYYLSESEVDSLSEWPADMKVMMWKEIESWQSLAVVPLSSIPRVK